MNWGKVVGILFALLYIFLSFNALQTDFYSAVQQIKSFIGLQDNLRFSVVSSNSSTIILKVENPLNVSIIVYNITGDYVYLEKSYVIPPQGSENLVLKVTNYNALINKINKNEETITISLRILNTTIDEVETL